MTGPPLTSAFFSACQLQLTSAFLPGSRGAFLALVEAGALPPKEEALSDEFGVNEEDVALAAWPAADAAAAASFFLLLARFLIWRRDSNAPLALDADSSGLVLVAFV